MHVAAGQIVDRPMCFLNVVFVAVLDMLATKTLLKKESHSGARRTRTISSFTLSRAKTAEFQTQQADITVNERPCTSRSDKLCEHGGKYGVGHTGHVLIVSNGAYNSSSWGGSMKCLKVELGPVSGHCGIDCREILQYLESCHHVQSWSCGNDIRLKFVYCTWA